MSGTLNDKLSSFSMKDELGSAVWDGLNSVKVSPAANFMNGVATTVFTAGNDILDKVDYVTGIAEDIQNGGSFMQTLGDQAYTGIMNTALVSSGTNLYNTVTNIDLNVYKDAIVKMSQKIVKQNLEVFYKNETDKLHNAMLDMPGYIVRRTAYWTTANIKSVAELTQELTKNIEDKQKDDSKKDEENRTKAKILEVKNTIGEIKDKYSYTIDSVVYGVDTITQYIQNGPEWIEKNLNKYIVNGVLTPTENWITKKVNDGISMVYGFADSMAENLGKKAAELINRAAKWAVQKALMLALKLKQFALNLAKSVLEKAKNLLAATLGIGLA